MAFRVPNAALAVTCGRYGAVPDLYTGQRTLRGWLQQQRARSVAFGSEENFANYNTPQDLEQPL